MVAIARQGGDTTRRAQCAKYREIAYKLGYKKIDIPEDVLNGRMQRFDKLLNFSHRASNQKKANRDAHYELDRLSRYIKDVVKKNVEFATDMVKA